MGFGCASSATPAREDRAKPEPAAYSAPRSESLHIQHAAAQTSPPFGLRVFAA